MFDLVTLSIESYVPEFWRIRGLVMRTAQGARATMNLSKGEPIDSQPL